MTEVQFLEAQIAQMDAVIRTINEASSVLVTVRERVRNFMVLNNHKAAMLREAVQRMLDEEGGGV